MLVTYSWWQFWIVGDRIKILVTSFECWCPTLRDRGCNILDVGDKNGQSHHQHLQIVTNIDVADENSGVTGENYTIMLFDFLLTLIFNFNLNNFYICKCIKSLFTKHSYLSIILFWLRNFKFYKIFNWRPDIRKVSLLVLIENEDFSDLLIAECLQGGGSKSSGKYRRQRWVATLVRIKSSEFPSLTDLLLSWTAFS